MVRTIVDPYLTKITRILYWFPNDTELKGLVLARETELRNLKMIFWCFATWDVDIDAEKIANLRSMFSSAKGIWEKFGQQITDSFPPEDEGEDVEWPDFKQKREDWDGLAAYLDVAIQQSKPLFEEICEDVLHGSLTCKPTASDEVLEFLDVVLLNLKALVRYKADKFLPVKMQVETLKQKLNLLRNFFKLTAHGCIDCKELGNLKICLRTLANDAACLAFLYWVKEADAGITTKLNLMLSDMLQKIIKPDVSALYLEDLKAIRLQRSDDTLLLGQTIANFVDLLLENPVASLQNDIQVLRDGLIFLLIFLADPPKKRAQYEEGKSLADPPKKIAQDEDGKPLADPPQECAMNEQLISIFDQIDVLLQQGSYLICPLDDMKEDFSDGKVLLNDFLDMIQALMDNVKLLFVEISYLRSSNFPTVNGLGFFCHLLQNIRILKEKLGEDALFIPFAKNYILKIDEKLVTLRPLLELHKDQHEAKDTWLEAIDLAYRIELVINSCSVILHPIWYNMICLAHILHEIKVIRRKLDQIKDCNMYNTGVLRSSVGSISEFSEKTSYSRTNELVVGFEKDVKIITGELIRGHQSLDVISIVGMAGQGKTTLAMKIYNDTSIRGYFHTWAFCFVSQVYNIRELLLGILSDMIVIDDKIQSMEKDDLAHQLWKCLSGRRYLIVVDDIWEITAWNDVKKSFPDEGNGSRVILTTRNEEVALKAKIKFSPHRLCFLSIDQSWNLLQKKTFGDEDYPPDLSRIGMEIAKSCKGLPLAVVLVAGILTREKGNKKLWNEVAEKTASYAYEEGCMDILELSYKYLPEQLKPCLLYFGIFSEDEFVPAKRLMLLWIGEGFIRKSERMSLQNSAMEYLSDLVARSLVIVAQKSSSAGIKTCRVHDLILDMCRRKAQEENFLQFMHGRGSSSSSNIIVCKQYRACIQMSWKYFVYGKRTGPQIHSLLHCHRELFYDTRNLYDDEERIFSNSKLIQVLHLGSVRLKSLSFITSLFHVKYVAVETEGCGFIPSSISNLWNLETFILRSQNSLPFFLPFAMGKIKRLRHLDVGECKLDFSSYEEEDYPQLNVESFSLLHLSQQTATEFLQRLPNVQKLSCRLQDAWYSRWEGKPSLALDFLSQLESLKLHYFKYKNPCVIFPSNLKKLSLFNFSQYSRRIPAIAKLPKLEVLKMTNSSLPKWDIEDEDFQSLKFLKLAELKLKSWNASMESFPRLEQLVLDRCKYLADLPACFKESSILKRIEVLNCKENTASSAVEIQKEQNDWGNEEFELIITNTYH